MGTPLRQTSQGEKSAIRPLLQNSDNFAAHIAAGDNELANRDRQVEASRPRAAGIEVKHAIAHLLLWGVAVAGDYDPETGGRGLEIELGEIVKDVDGNTGEFDDFCLREFAGPRGLVDIAADRGHGREGCK
jgi:hypothetical protein